MIAKTSRTTERVVLPGISARESAKIVAALGLRRERYRRHRSELELPRFLGNVSWKSYGSFLSALGDNHVRHCYDQGTLEMMSPLKDHDWIKRLIGRFIETMAYDLRIEIQSIGSTTITSDLIERGFEPDEAYYVANEPKVRGKKRFEPDVDPPPDLILEVDVTSSSRSREKLYAALKVPELWRHDGNDLVFFRRTRNGQYKAIARSLAFPFLTPADITRFLDQAESVSETKLTRRFAQWARRRKNESSSN